MGVWGYQKRVLGTFKLELQAGVNHPVWVLGVKLQSSARAASALTVDPSPALSLRRSPSSSHLAAHYVCGMRQSSCQLSHILSCPLCFLIIFNYTCTSLFCWHRMHVGVCHGVPVTGCQLGEMGSLFPLCRSQAWIQVVRLRGGHFCLGRPSCRSGWAPTQHAA